MEQKTDIKPRKKKSYIIVTVVLLLLLLEGLASMYFYQTEGLEKLASIEALKSIKRAMAPQASPVNVVNQNYVRPDSSESVNLKVAEETVESNKFVHKSWVEFSNIDFDGKYMTMKDAIRTTVPAAYINPEASDTINIYFFGGSTMFGFNVLDHETIPSQFVELYKQKYPHGKSLRVFNYGTPTYYSYQELVLMSDLIFNGHKPDIAIFLDGINDFWFATASYYKQSYFSYVFRQVFNRGLRSESEFHFVDTADAMFKDPQYVPKETYNNTIINNYFTNMENIRMMADMTNTKTYFFCQPSPFYNYPNQLKDPMCFKDTNTRFNYIYPIIKKRSEGLKNFTFLGDMLKDEQGYPFVDGLHYSPKFIRKVAEKILHEIESDTLNFKYEPKPETGYFSAH